MCENSFGMTTLSPTYISKAFKNHFASSYVQACDDFVVSGKLFPFLCHFDVLNANELKRRETLTKTNDFHTFEQRCSKFNYSLFELESKGKMCN